MDGILRLTMTVDMVLEVIKRDVNFGLENEKAFEIFGSRNRIFAICKKAYTVEGR